VNDRVNTSYEHSRALYEIVDGNKLELTQCKRSDDTHYNNIHKSQGASFDKKYTIHEWARLDRRLKYVALSRATNENNVKIKI
jgi:hypothetical protein